MRIAREPSLLAEPCPFDTVAGLTSGGEPSAPQFTVPFDRPRSKKMIIICSSERPI